MSLIMAPLSRKKKTKTISWRKKHNGLPFRTPVCTGWVLLLQRFEPKERLFTAICLFPRKGYGPPGNMFSPHWIPVPDVICLIHLFPARMLHSWRCGLDPSGGRREGVGRQQGGTDERKERRMRAQRRDAAAQPRYWQAEERGRSCHTLRPLCWLKEIFYRPEGRGHSGCSAGIEWVELKLCLRERTDQTRT